MSDWRKSSHSTHNGNCVEVRSELNWRKSIRSINDGACVEVANWRKSARSISNGACVEVGEYRTSTRSGGNGQCVEVGSATAEVAVRDTVDRDGVTLTFPARAWGAFTASLR